MTKPGLPINNADGTPKWRMAPSPHGPYWNLEMQRGYQDVGAWTIIKSTPLELQKWVGYMLSSQQQNCVIEKISCGFNFHSLSLILNHKL